MVKSALSAEAIRQFWAAVYASFNPSEPVRDPKLRAPRAARYSPVEKVVPALLTPFEHRRVLVAGAIGSGKSTELLMIAERLAPERVVVLVDLWRHMDRAVKDLASIERLQSWELIGLLGLAILRVGTERFGHDFDGADEALAKALSAQSQSEAQLDVAKLATGLAVTVGGALGAATGGPAGAAAAVTGLKVLESIGGAWTWKIGLSRKRSDQHEGVRSVVAAVRMIIESLRDGLARRKIVIIIDGLDRVRQPEAFEGLFVESDLLRQLECDVIVSAHLAMVQRYRGRMRFDQRFDLANEPVADYTDPWSLGSGIHFFRELVSRRIEALGEVEVPAEAFPESLLDRLAWCSGGRLRDFMGFIRNLAEYGHRNELAEISAEIVESIVDDERRRRSDGVTEQEIAVLEGLVRDPRHRLPGGGVALGLLEQQLILSYPNEDAWYLPHPLLMLTLIRPGSPGSAVSSD